MKRIVMLALMMLIGGYGTAQAQSMMEMEQVTEMEEATKDFLGLEWGAGIGVMGSFGGDDAVEKASIVDGKVQVDEEGDMRPQMFLEMHVFSLNPKAIDWRKYQRWKSAKQMADMRSMDTKTKVEDLPMPDPPLMGFGPFIALQSSDNSAIDALTLGVMWGFRKDPMESASLNVGLGVSFDPSVQVLGGGLKEGGTTDAMTVTYKKEGRIGWAVMASFTF